MGNIVVVGSSNTDMVVKVPTLPAPGETVLGGTFFTAAGGKGANQAVAAARAGGTVTLVACVGEDTFGAQAVEGFQADGIDTTFVFPVPAVPSGVALIMVDEAGENSIAVASGANASLRPDHLEKAEEAIAEAEVVLVQLETPLETVAAAVRMAARHGTRLILNPAPAQTLSGDLLRDVSVLTPNVSETRLLTGLPLANTSDLGAAASSLLAQGVGGVIITLGADGLYLADGEGQEWVPAFDVEAEDTTGAGDVFNGALAVALADHQPLRAAARFAAAAAALSVTRRGAQPSAPYRAEVMDFFGGRGDVGYGE